MNIYTIIRLIYDYLNGDKETRYILDYHILYFVPAINIDGYFEISKNFQLTNVLEYIRKNRNPGIEHSHDYCGKDSIGVDLNRNYGYKFGHSMLGSSNEPCYEDYRGPESFSEPETKAIK